MTNKPVVRVLLILLIGVVVMARTEITDAQKKLVAAVKAALPTGTRIEGSGFKEIIGVVKNRITDTGCTIGRQYYGDLDMNPHEVGFKDSDGIHIGDVCISLDIYTEDASGTVGGTWEGEAITTPCYPND